MNSDVRFFRRKHVECTYPSGIFQGKSELFRELGGVFALTELRVITFCDEYLICQMLALLQHTVIVCRLPHI